MNELTAPGVGQPDREPRPAEPPPVQSEVGGPEQTGHPAVDSALQALAEVAGATPADQLPAYQAAHRTLRETLASIDET